MAIDVVKELLALRSLHGGALYNELTELGERIRAEEISAALVASAPAGPPVVRDAPYAGQEGDQLTCTMGNWEGEPTGYAYQWGKDGLDVDGGTEAAYTLVAGDEGSVFVCEVTATNAGGSTPVLSNEVVAAAPAGRSRKR